MKNKTENKYSGILLEQSLLVCFPLLYFFLIYNKFWVYPLPSDPLQYMGGVEWGTTYAFFPWLDRIMVANGLRLVSLVPSISYLAGPIYIGLCNVVMLCLCLHIAYRRTGFWAACCVGVFWNTSLLLLGWSTYVYADQTLALYSLIAYSVMYGGDIKSDNKSAVLGGFFAGLAVMSKITGVATIGALAFCLLLERSKSRLLLYVSGLFIGVISALVLYVSLYDVASLMETVQMFFGSNLSKNLSLSRPNLVTYTDDVLVSLKYLPFIGLFIAINWYKERRNIPILLVIWSHILIITLLYSITQRGGWAIPHYLYTPYVLSILFLSMVIGDINRLEEKKVFCYVSGKLGFKLTAVGFLCIAILAGLQCAEQFPPVTGNSTRYIYQEIPTIFNGRLKESVLYPFGVRWLYSFGPLLVLALFSVSLCQIFNRYKLIGVCCFLLFLSVWGGACNGGMALHKTSREKSDAKEMYAYASTLKNISLDRYFVYIEAASDARERKRFIWIYHLFFDKGLEKDKHSRARFDAVKKLVNSVVWIKNRNQLKEYASAKTLKYDDVVGFYRYLLMKPASFIEKMMEKDGINLSIPKFIVTDVPGVIKKEWPSAKIKKELSVADGKRQAKLYILAM